MKEIETVIYTTADEELLKTVANELTQEDPDNARDLLEDIGNNNNGNEQTCIQKQV